MAPLFNLTAVRQLATQSIAMGSTFLYLPKECLNFAHFLPHASTVQIQSSSIVRPLFAFNYAIKVKINEKEAENGT